MKKLAFTALLGLTTATTAFAAPVGSTFTGFSAGVDLSSLKFNETKRASGVGIVADYAFDYGNNFVGLVEGKIKFNSSKLLDRSEAGAYSKLSEKWRANLSYLQGYRVLPDLLPYVKVGYIVSKMEAEDYTYNATSSSSRSTAETGSGLGVGLGLKYAVSSNFELGAEYFNARLKFDGEREKAHIFSLNASYRF